MPTCQGQYILLQSLQHTVNVAQGSGGADRVPITLSSRTSDCQVGGCVGMPEHRTIALEI